MNSHWEFDSKCPKCGNTTHIKTPVGERVVRVKCEHCIHGHEYTHIVHDHEIVNS